jgi:hypothetical protein
MKRIKPDSAPYGSCTCPCSCWAQGVPDDGTDVPAWCDACRMGIHSGDRPRPKPVPVSDTEIWCGDPGNCVNGPAPHLWQPATCRDTP